MDPKVGPSVPGSVLRGYWGSDPCLRCIYRLHIHIYIHIHRDLQFSLSPTLWSDPEADENHLSHRIRPTSSDSSNQDVINRAALLEASFCSTQQLHRSSAQREAISRLSRHVVVGK